MKKAIIVHGWGGSPKNDWLPWLKKELEKKGYVVFVPIFPNTDSPDITDWVNKLKEVAGAPDENTLLIGHSIGCQTILRYLETLKSPVVFYKILFVAPWLMLTNLENKESQEIAKPWLTTSIDFEKVKKHYKKMIAFFSDDDYFVPLKNKELFEKKLNIISYVVCNRGHFTEDDKVTEIPELLKII